MYFMRGTDLVSTVIFINDAASAIIHSAIMNLLFCHQPEITAAIVFFSHKNRKMKKKKPRQSQGKILYKKTKVLFFCSIPNKC